MKRQYLRNAAKPAKPTKIQLKYRCATDGQGNILDVTKLEKRPAAAFCLGCGRSMTTRMGAIRTWHFAHRVPAPGEPPCAPETYRHILAKNVFQLKFKQALREKRPFEVEMAHTLRCSYCTEFPNCALTFGEKLRRWDLTRHYDGVLLEEKYGQFIPDLRLVHSAHPHRSLCVEIKVTHASTEQKREVLKMIEIDAQDESVVDAFDDFCVHHGQFSTNLIEPAPLFCSVRCVCGEQAERERILKEKEAEREREEKAQAQKTERQKRSWMRDRRREAKITMRDALISDHAEMPRYEFRNQGEPEVDAGTWRIVRSPSERKPVVLAEITVQLNFSGQILWYDHERGIAIRRMKRQWHPYLVQTPDGEFGFPRLQEALIKFKMLSDRLDGE